MTLTLKTEKHKSAGMVPFTAGGAVLEGLLPRRHLPKYHAYEPYGPFVLLAVIAIPALGRIFVVPAEYVTVHLYNGLHALFGA